MTEKTASTKHNLSDKYVDHIPKEKEMYFGIIAINELGAAYVQMYKKGDEIEALVFDDKRFLEKDKDKKVEKLLKKISEKDLFAKDSRADYELVLSTTEDYMDQLGKFEDLSVKPRSTRLITLPENSSAPIKDTLRLLEDNPSPEKGCSVKERKAKLEGNADKNKSSAQEDSQFEETHETEQKSSVTHPPKPRRGSGSSTNSARNEEKETGFKKFMPSLKKKKDDSTKQDLDSGTLISIIDEHFKKVDERLKNIESMMGELRTKVDKVEANIDILLTGEKQENLNYSTAQKSKAPPLPPNKPVLTGLPCHFQPAPAKVTKIQTQFSSQLTQKLKEEKLHIMDDPSGPTFVFSVNSSRLISDIQRDLKTDNSHGPTFLLIIKPTMKPEDSLETLDLRHLGFDHVKEAAYLLVDTNNKHLHQCNTNEETLASVIQFLKRNKEGTRI